MSMIKKGVTKSRIVVSSLIYVCECGHTELGDSGKRKHKKCPKCGGKMSAISSENEDKK